MKLKLLLAVFALFTASCLDPGAGGEDKEPIASVDVSYSLYVRDSDQYSCVKEIAYIPNTEEGRELANTWVPDLQKELCENSNLTIIWDCMKQTRYNKTVESGGAVITKKEEYIGPPSSDRCNKFLFNESISVRDMHVF
jgi:hypothetical protein